ncbi:MAG: flagellar motor switch protein FliN [Myxococcota bacterium]|jgi:flagellar motor switch protein FliN|nr:flagellar motor switch protein FliN [Myxococcota bacterium]
MTDPNRHPHSQNPRPSSPPQRPSLAEAIGLSGGGQPGRNDSTSKSLEALGFVMDVPVELTVEIGRKNLKIADVLRLGPGSVVELTKDNGEPLDVYVNNRLVARGEAVVVGERYGVRLTEVLVGDREA